MDEQIKQLTFQDLVEILSRRRWLIVVFVVVIGIAGTLFALAKPDVYSAKTVFLVKDPAVVSQLYGASLVSVPFTRRLATIEEDIRAFDNVRRVVEYLNLARGGKTVDGVARRILQGLDLTVLTSKRGDTTVVLEYTDTSPTAARDVANGLREQYVASLVNGYLDQVKRVVEQERENLDKLNEAQKNRLDDIRALDDKNLLDLATQISKTSRDVQRIESEMAKVDTRIRQKENAIEKAREDLDGTKRVNEKVKVERNPRFDAALKKTLELRKKVGELEELYHDTYLPLVSAQKDLARAEAALEKEEEFIRREVQKTDNEKWLALKAQITKHSQQIDTLKRDRRGLESQKQALDRTARQLPQLKQQYAALEMALSQGEEAIGQANAQFVRARNNWNNARESALLYFEVVDEARKPSNPSGPNRMLWIIGSIIVGLGAGVGLSVALHMLSRSLVSVTEAKTMLDIPVMGSVQTIQSNLEIERGRRRHAMAAVLAMLMLFAGAAFIVVYTQFPELLPGFVRDSITAFREQIR